VHRIVIDTNVLISDMLFPDSIPSRAVRKATACAEIVVSRESLDELAEVLTRAKFERYLPVERRIQALQNYVKSVTVVTILTRIHACRDPRDNHVLEAAINGRADTIITGDVDLLALHPFHGIRIVTPEDYLATA
jgi:putative PIN family toxin of toxin-antitoxin system